MEEGDFFTAFVPIPRVIGATEGLSDNRLGKTNGSSASEIMEAISALMQLHEFVTVPMVAACVSSVGERTVRRHMNMMAEQGFLIREGAGRGTRYKLVPGK